MVLLVTDMYLIAMHLLDDKVWKKAVSYYKELKKSEPIAVKQLSDNLSKTGN